MQDVFFFTLDLCCAVEVEKQKNLTIRNQLWSQLRLHQIALITKTQKNTTKTNHIAESQDLFSF
jgi:hypothetical protein